MTGTPLQAFRRSVDLFVFSSLYIALCAVLMIWLTQQLLTDGVFPRRLAAFVFFSTICSYNFHWFLTPASAKPSRRVVWTQHHKILHFILYLIGAIGSIVYFISLIEFWPALCLGALLTFLYTAPKLPQTLFKDLKRVAVGKTLFLSGVWTYVTSILPVFVSHHPWTGVCTIFAINRFLLIYAICILFDYRDREDDKTQQIRSLITFFDERGINILFYLSLAAFVLSGIGLYLYHYPIRIICILLLPGILLGLLYRRAKRDFSDDLYYIVLDGLMMFSGLLLLVLSI